MKIGVRHKRRGAMFSTLLLVIVLGYPLYLVAVSHPAWVIMLCLLGVMFNRNLIYFYNEKE